jgi:hypothetical protein
LHIASLAYIREVEEKMTVSYGTKPASNVDVGSPADPQQDKSVIDWSEALQDWRKFITDPRETEVFSALDNPDWDFRTIEGLERETGVDGDEVRRVLGKYAVLIRAVPSAKYGTVYQLKNRTVQTNDPLIDRALDFISLGKRRKIA